MIMFMASVNLVYLGNFQAMHLEGSKYIILMMYGSGLSMGNAFSGYVLPYFKVRDCDGFVTALLLILLCNVVLNQSD